MTEVQCKSGIAMSLHPSRLRCAALLRTRPKPNDRPLVSGVHVDNDAALHLAFQNVCAELAQVFQGCRLDHCF